MQIHVRDLLLGLVLVTLVGTLGLLFFVCRDLDNQRKIQTTQTQVIDQNAKVLGSVVNLLRGQAKGTAPVEKK